MDAMDFDESLFADEFHFEPNYSLGIELSQSTKSTTSTQMRQTTEIPPFEFDENLFDDEFEFPSFSFGLPQSSQSTTADVHLVPDTNRPAPASVNAISSSTKFDLFIADQKAKSTVYKDTSDGRTLRNFFRTYGEERELHCIPAGTLDKLLAEFFMSGTKRNGCNYEPDSLNSIRNSLQRILHERGSKLDLKSGSDFVLSRKVLTAKRKQLTKAGFGNKPNATRPLTKEEEDFLYQQKYFGVETPCVLQRTVWWIISIHYGYRARDESRKLKWGDLKLRTDLSGTYLLWDIERGAKTRTGATVQGQNRAFDPRAYATGGPRCPVMIYSLYKSHRPAAALTDESPFYLELRREGKFDYSKDVCWYKAAPLGKNELGKFMSKARSILPGSIGGAKGKISNHTVRKTSITKLLESNVPPILVQQISGHKRTESLLSYYTASVQQQKHMSNILSGDCSSHSGSSPTSAAVDFQVQKKPVESTSNLDSIFTGATFNGCTFNFGGQPNTDPEQISLCPAIKKPRVIYESDSD